MWDRHTNRILMAKHRIALLQLNLAPIRSKPYWAGPKTHKFEKPEIDKMLAENII